LGRCKKFQANSANVKEIIEKFNLKTQIRHMAAKDVLINSAVTGKIKVPQTGETKEVV
jgi:type I restriction enzyme M protein